MNKKFHVSTKPPTLSLPSCGTQAGFVFFSAKKMNRKNKEKAKILEQITLQNVKNFFSSIEHPGK